MTNLIKEKEWQTCNAYIDYLRLRHPTVFSHLIKIDNEGTTNRAKAVKLGLHAGASDYFIALPRGQYAGLWIEVKPPGWKLTKSKLLHHDRQINFGKKMTEAGYKFAFCVGFDECVEATESYLASQAQHD